MNEDNRPAAPADDADGSDGREGQGRSFIGRLLGAFAADPTDGDAPAEELAPTASAPRLANLMRLRVDDVAIPKSEIVDAPVTIGLAALTSLFREHGFSRIPVYGESPDHPLGLLHLKDLALRHGFGASEPFDLRAMLRPLLYVPPSMPIGVLLQQMQRDRTHMALVIDEYGGVDGLVTIEDLIEQVIGQINDEHDELEGQLWTLERPGQWLVQGRAPLEEVEAETGLDLVPDGLEDEVDTLGGLVVLLAGRVPTAGEVIRHPQGPALEVVEADTRRVTRVRLREAG